MTAPLPPFDPHLGALPPGWHPASTEAVKARCVEDALFPRADAAAPIHRNRLFSGYRNLHDALTLLGIETEQWIGGDFVSTCPLPAHVDVVNFCDARLYESLPVELKAMILRYLRGSESVGVCHCASHLVPKGPPDHPCNADYLTLFNYWQALLGHDPQGRPKGIIGVAIEPQPSRETDDPTV